MNNRTAIQEELKQLNSRLPAEVKEPVFNVPEGYFENFAASLLARIKGEGATTAADELQMLSPLLAAIPKQNPYSVPADYFQRTATDLPLLTKEETVPSFLSEAGKRLPYAVPSGYFENLPDQILAKAARPKAKVISINYTRWMRTAVAAVIIGIVAVSGVLYFSNRNNGIDPTKYPEAWVAKKLQNVSNRALDEFIRTADVSGSGLVQNKPANQEVRQLLHDVSNQELDAFLHTVHVEDEELLVN